MVLVKDDTCWQTQHRVPVEVQPPQIGKISIPEFNDIHEVHRTVIVNKPETYQKVKWNEFPEEITPEIGAAPKVPAQDWKPINQENLELQRSLYRPAKIAAVWPPPEREIPKMTSPFQGRNQACEARRRWQLDPAGSERRHPICRMAATIEDRSRLAATRGRDGSLYPPFPHSGPSHMPAVQWPPAESEQHEREQVEVLQKHIPARKMEYQWPPPPPVYQGDSDSNGFSACSAS
ncbi:unnamed protein product [Nippostrongylus brasiliensis]|uniref:ZM domain-containing protein n=1 Tax=Nippostrongylus brasiliensis TaxID=27835 RepID=A0A0N4YCG6_NIPBR|nr:unnamed protein product [Nippostrongylus brasiliensis]